MAGKSRLIDRLATISNPLPWLAISNPVPWLALSSLLWLSPAQAALRGNIEISSGHITLGDLFDNAGAKAKTVVQPAPAPGKSLEFPISRLRALASDFELAWRSPTFQGPVVIHRRGVRLFPEHVRRALSNELTRLGIRGNWTIEPNGLPDNVWLPAEMAEPGQLPIHGFMFDQRRGRFSAMLKVPIARGMSRNLRLAGKAYEMVNVVALKRSVSRGSVLRKRDLTLRLYRANRIRNSVYSNIAEVVGLQARRPLGTGELIQTRDLQPMIAVRKGAMVTILVRTPSMTLSTIGRALANAAVGDVIPILNEQSKRTIKATVLSNDTVRAIYRRRIAFARTK